MKRSENRPESRSRAGRKAQVIYEPLPPVAGYGLFRLPQPSAGDIYFDFEGGLGVFESGGIDGADISRGYDLQHFGAIVPAGGQLRVQLSLIFFDNIRNGRVQASFATAARRLLTPGVLFVATDM
jgi:hypothetical protein